MNDSQARDIALVVGLTGMSTVIVMLRIIARMKGKATFGADDYWIFAAAALNLPYMGVYIWGLLLADTGPGIADVHRGNSRTRQP